MMAIMKIVAFTVIFLSSQTIASQNCNLYNFGLNGIQCGLRWWQDNDLGEIVNVTYKVSKLVENSLASIGLLDTYEYLNMTLHGNIKAESADPFAKVVESVLVVEPIYAAIIADMVIGLEITADEMERFGLPRELANKETLIQMVKEYVDFSCTLYGVRSFTDCLSNWMLPNCEVVEDKTIYITKVLRALDNTYCEGEASDPDVVNIFTKDLGSMSKAVAKLFGIVRDPESPFLFKISEDSILTNRQAMEQLANRLNSDCGFYVTALTPDIIKLMQENSTVGAGAVFKSMMGVLKSYMQCSFESQSRIEPELFNSSILEEYNVLMARYGLSELSAQFIVGKKRRYTVSVFGDPHMVIYKEFDPITCSALGWQTYLFNGFFHLQGYAEPAADGSEGSYVSKVRIAFQKDIKPTSYISGEGTKPANHFELSSGQKVNQTSTLRIIEVEDGVQIIQTTSGAVFAFHKYRNTYFFIVRMGEDVFDLSYGLLATGCTDPIEIQSKRRKRSAECDAACASAGPVYRDTCLFDCDVTGDVGVGKVSEGIRDLKTEVAKEDEKVMESLGIKSITMPGNGKSAVRASSHLTAMLIVSIMKYIYI